jgi:hypothetical protein
MTAISIIPLKEQAIRFPEPVKTLILSEPDSMESKELISKLATWDRLLQINAGKPM